MEISKLFNLPAHPLLVHIPVVLIPLAALGTIVIAVSPRLRACLGWIVAGLAVVGSIGAFLAAGSGEALRESVKESETLDNHAELGDAAKIFGLVFAIAVVAFMVLVHWNARRSSTPAPDPGTGVDGSADPAVASPTPTQSRALPKWVVSAAAVVAVLTGALATVWIVETGHSGAKATWENVDIKGGG